MSKRNHKKLIDSIKIIKYPIFGVHQKNIKESIKTSNYQYKTVDIPKKPVILKFIKNNVISKAIQKKNAFNQTSKSTFVDENLINNSIKKRVNLTSLTFDNYNKDNKQNKAYLLFNNPLLNQKYHNVKNNQFNNLAKVKDHYLKLNGIYNPHKNYSEIVSDRKKIIKVFLAQTKNNFNNNYYLIYSNPDKQKRNYISQCFETIKNNNKKNIDKENSIKSLAEKEIYNKSKDKLFKSSKRINKKSMIRISIPSSFDIDNFVSKNHKFKIQTLNFADDILKEYGQPIKEENKRRLIKSAFFKKAESKSHNFFKTRENVNHDNNKFK